MPVITTLTLLAASTISTSVNALTTKQLLEACEANARPCHELPFANAYIGGALDLLGTLKDSDKINMQFACESTNEVFDVKRILIYLDENHEGYEDKNAMSLVIKYFEEEKCIKS